MNLGQQLVNLVHYLRSYMLEQKPLANAILSTVLQSNGIRSLLSSVTFSSPNPPKLFIKTKQKNSAHLCKQYHKCFQILSSYLSLSPPPPPPHTHTLTRLASLLNSFCALRRYRNDHYYYYSAAVQEYGTLFSECGAVISESGTATSVSGLKISETGTAMNEAWTTLSEFRTAGSDTVTEEYWAVTRK